MYFCREEIAPLMYINYTQDADKRAIKTDYIPLARRKMSVLRSTGRHG